MLGGCSSLHITTMFIRRWSLALCFILSETLAAPQFPVQLEAVAPRKLHGRFLQITDLHPDPHYKPHTSLTKACHRKKPKKKKKRSSFWGTPYSYALSTRTQSFLTCAPVTATHPYDLQTTPSTLSTSTGPLK